MKCSLEKQRVIGLSAGNPEKEKDFELDEVSMPGT